MKKNYYPLEDIEAELKNVALDNFLNFNTNDNFQFARYESELVRSFENWLKRVTGFREAVNARQQKKEEMRSAKIGEYLKIGIETIDKKSRLGATTQLTKPRFPPLWSG